ncbi:MAG: hypothetical protein Q8891_12670 [Bacteroidota bacterium]|nr:hypothetical protein [Bacteroidota bacterium]
MSCKKSQFSTTPSLKFENVNTKNLHPGEIIEFTLSFTYKGDLTGNLLVQELVPKCSTDETDSINTIYTLPPFPASQQQKGEITVSYGYNVTGYSPITTPQCVSRNDTAVFRFVLKDDAMHISDTVSSPPVVIYYQ